jgi:N-methylhydantoinase B
VTQPRRSTLTTTTKLGDVFRHDVAAGGWGDLLERDPALVLKDVRNDFVSERGAREDYGVVVAGQPLAVDEAATRALRDEIWARRKGNERPIYNWGTAMQLNSP